MNNVMLDLETMGTKPYSAIVSIGAVRFGAEGIQDTFYVDVSLESCVDRGMSIDASTVIWWMKQPDDARACFMRSSTDIETALQRFSSWIDDDPEVWGDGSDFDNVLLECAYERCNMPVPWEFWSNRCYRTIKNLCPQIAIVSTGVKHNAVDDARSQALHLVECLKSMKNGHEVL